MRDDSNPELSQLYEAIKHKDEELRQEYRKVGSTWHLSLGFVRLGGAVNAELITLIYVIFNGLCLIAGIAVAFLGGIFTSVGVALIVGSLFAFGAYLAQFFVVAFQREQSAYYYMAGDKAYGNIRTLFQQREELAERIQRLGGDYDTDR